ncbi:MAG: pseudouridine synthase [Nitrososphaerales archaeon]
MLYLKRILLSLDQTINVLMGGQPDETISAKSWRMKDKSLGWNIARRIIDKLFWFDKDHCYSSYLAELNREHISTDYSKR